MATPTLETERLVLRPLRLTDAPAAQKLISNWNVVEYLSSVPWPYPADGSERFYAEVLLPDVEAGRAHAWAITLRSNDDAFIGSIDFYLELSNEREQNRGFWLGEQFWGNGYMTEAIAAVNGFVFGELGIESFRTSNATANIASSQLKASGVGRLIEVVEEDLVSGRQPAEVWEITKQDWLARCKK